MTRTEINSHYRRRNIDAGLCSTCGQTPATGKRRCRPCLDASNTATKKRQARLRAEGKCLKCGGVKEDTTKVHCRRCADVYIAKQRERKATVFNAYGGCFCACCGEKTFEFLTLDHINGGGRAHRQSLNNQNIYQVLIRQKFPPGFQILCYNCNCAKGLYGRCPHQKDK